MGTQLLWDSDPFVANDPTQHTLECLWRKKNKKTVVDPKKTTLLILEKISILLFLKHPKTVSKMIATGVILEVPNNHWEKPCLLKCNFYSLPDYFPRSLFFFFSEDLLDMDHFKNLYWICYSIAFLKKCFGPLATRHVGPKLPDQRLKLLPLHWKKS